MEARFPWVRRWTPRHGPASGGAQLRRRSDGSAPLAAWADEPCLVLLGEGGLGKTQELQAERDRLLADGTLVRLCDLASTTDRHDLRSGLPVVSPGQRLTVLIDSFDEVSDDVNDITDILIAYFEGLDRDTVNVRITSRPVVWSSRLERALHRLWPRVAVLGLEPISPGDIQLAAAAVLGDRAEPFVTAIRERDLWSLASTPTTLDHLLAVFDDRGTVGDNRLSIHRDGIARLTAEGHERRVDRGRTGAPTAERVAAAGRLALLSVVGGKHMIATRHPAAGDAPVLDLDDVAGRDGIALETLRAVAQSGVFRPAGSDQVTWSHHGVAEVLAADQLRGWPLPALLTLLAHPTKPTRIAPQLASVAAWIAVTHEELFTWLVEHDVDVLLNANLHDLSDERRAQVANAVIARVVAGQPFDWRSLDVVALGHAGLAAAIRAPLQDPNTPAMAKADLVQIARRASERGVDELLIDMVVTAAPIADYEDEVSLARWAILALEGADDGARAARLAAIALDPATNVWIRADLLERLYPGPLSTKDVLSALPSDSFGGLDDSTFHGVARRVQAAANDDVEDLLLFLDWLGGQPGDAHHDHFFGDLFDPAASAASRQLDDARVLDALARLVGLHADITCEPRVPPEVRAAPADQRRRLLEAAVGAAEDHLTVAGPLADALLDAHDFEHYLTRLETEHVTDVDWSMRPWAIDAADAAFRRIPEDQWEAVTETAKGRHPTLAELIETTWGAPRRTTRAKAVAADADRTRRRHVERTRDRFNQARLDDALASDAWSLVALELSRPVDESADTGVRHTMERPISALPAWRQIDEARQHTIVEIAANYLRTAALEGGIQWLGDAIALVADTQAELLDAIEGSRWLTLVAGLFATYGHHDTCAYAIRRAADHDRAALNAVITNALREDVTTKGHASALDRLGEYEPTGLAELLVELACDDGIDGHTCGRLLSHALARGSRHAATAAVDIVRSRPPRPPSVDVVEEDETTTEAVLRRRWGRGVAAGAALAVAPSALRAGIPLFELLTDDWAFTSAVIARLGLHRDDELLASLTSDELARLFTWVDGHLEVPRHPPGRGFTVNPVDESLNTILETIGRREDEEAAAALARIAMDTGRSGIHVYARRVESAALASTWRPVPLDDLRHVIGDTTRRVIETREQLGVAVLEALTDYSRELATSSTLRQRLWKSPPRSDCNVPTDEDGLSAELQMELQARLRQRVTIHREVRIEARAGHQAASDVDLLVTMSDDRRRALSCIVEVKASWYPRLIARVRQQLADRYLRGPEGDVGTFVVMWFAATNWCISDPRSHKTRKDRRRLEHDLATAIAGLRAAGRVHGIVVDCSLERHD